MKNYLIVGASSGIGKQLAEQLAINNNVLGTFNKHPIDSDTIQYHFLDVLATEYDLSFLPEVLDGIAYCPGAINLKPFARIKNEDFEVDYKLQVLGAVKIIQQCLPKLKQSSQASIVLFSTIAVQTGFNFHSMVAVSKGAIEGLTKSLAAEFAPNIRVNCIAPSITNTPLAASLLNSSEKIEANAQRHPLKKIGSAEDIANLAEFLITEKSAWITGQVIHADGVWAF
ncbi:MAG: SDR family oxidoreductase [Bacteroidetes bacterium]|nr:SDR family oxidoreductase [Bacteroidota bacterium]